MSNIRSIDMMFLDDIFDMGSGYVLNFSDRTEHLRSSSPKNLILISMLLLTHEMVAPKQALAVF